MNTCKLNKRVRLILGLNEEVSWKCIEYYKKHEEIPSIGFSPDADFPVIYAEKGVLSFSYDQVYVQNEKLEIKQIKCENPLNVVPKICTVKLECFDTNELMANIIEINANYNFDIVIRKIDNEILEIDSKGKAAHAAHPDLGDNAVSKMIIILSDLFEKYNCKIELFEFFKQYINTEYTGKTLGINYEDESGALTFNSAQLKLEDGKLKIGFNLRIPVHTEIIEVEKNLKEVISKFKKINYNIISKMEPLFISKESDLVQKLLGIYNKKTNSNEEPVATGGATYARAFPNCVSFGANFPGNPDMCHQNDEYVKIDNLILACKIYAEAIYELSIT